MNISGLLLCMHTEGVVVKDLAPAPDILKNHLVDAFSEPRSHLAEDRGKAKNDTRNYIRDFINNTIKGYRKVTFEERNFIANEEVSIIIKK